MTFSTRESNPECPLCHSDETRTRPGDPDGHAGDWEIHQCIECRTSFLWPMPDPQILASYYDSDYYGRGDGKFLGPVEGIVGFFRYLRARTIRKFYHRAKAIKGLVPGGRVLDVGCGRALMLQYLKRWGYEVEGVELDNAAALRAGKNLAQPVLCSLEEVIQSSPGLCDVVCFWHSLEHLPEPGKALDTAYRLLAPGGLLVIAAPHMESMQSRLSGRRWLHLDLPRHLVHFDMKHLSMFLQNKGYQLIREDYFSQEYNVIDTLCYLYTILGFNHLYPFNLIRDVERHGACRPVNLLETLLGLTLLTPLTGLAFFVSNFFSVLGSGSTATLFLRKPN